MLADGFKGYLQYIPSVNDSLRQVATGTSVYGISKHNIKSIPIGLPAIPEQQAIAAVLSDVDALISSLEQRRAKTRALKQGVMQELLTGKTSLPQRPTRRRSNNRRTACKRAGNGGCGYRIAERSTTSTH